jgi:tripartite-type tricarboxylate transporter receptor subunit TctC
MPSLDEAGVTGYDIYSWMGALVPAGTPDAVVAKLNQAIAEAVKAPDLVKAFAERGIIPVSTNEATLANRIRDDIARWTQTAREANIHIDQ